MKTVLRGTLAGAVILLGTLNLSPRAIAATAQAPSKPYAGVHLTFSRWAGPDADAMNALLPQFEKQTGIQVTMDAIAYDSLHQKQVLDLSSHSANYDVLWAPEVWVPEYARAGWLLPLRQFVGDSTLNTPDFAFNDFIPAILKTSTYKGTLYGLPTFVQTPIVVYRKDLFASAKLNPPATWADTLADAGYFQKKGMGGIAVPAKRLADSVDVWAALMRSAGGDYFDAQGHLSVNSAPAVAALQYWDSLIAAGPRGNLGWTWDDVNTNLLQGQVPMGITISGIASQFTNASMTKLVGKFGYAPLPYKLHLSGTLADWNWVINKDTKNPKAAYLLIAWLTSKSVEHQLGVSQGSISARASLFNAPDLVSHAPWLPAVLLALKNARTQPLVPQSAQISDIMQRQISLASSGSASPQSALDAANQQIAKLVGK
jgi:multiple sugar transport system substrate-binding protein